MHGSSLMKRGKGYRVTTQFETNLPVSSFADDIKDVSFFSKIKSLV